jgi:hypothetical protein
VDPSPTRSFFIGLSIAESFALGTTIVPEPLSLAFQEHRFPLLGHFHGPITQLALLNYYKAPFLTAPDLPSSFFLGMAPAHTALQPHLRAPERLVGTSGQTSNEGIKANRKLLRSAITLSAAALHFSDINSVLPWAIDLLQKYQSAPVQTRQLTGALFLLTLLWGYGNDLSFEELIQQIQGWRKRSVAMQSPIPDACWWEYEQALWILREVGILPMLDFVNTITQREESRSLTAPAELELLSLVPFLIHTAQQNAYAEGITITLGYNWDCAVTAAAGAIIALRCKEECVPFWMREQAQHRWLLEDSWSIGQEEEWTAAWLLKYPFALEKIKKLTRKRLSRRGKNKESSDEEQSSQLKLF